MSLNASPPTTTPKFRRFTAGASELFGDKALALKHGKLALAIVRGRVSTIEQN